ncbi:MAG: rhomboid family intramembrane serine protease [Gammaproteobacteria bacterium]
MRRFFIPGFAPVYVIGGASFAGALLFSHPPEWLVDLFGSRWSPQYFLLATFMHAGFLHALLNVAALFFIGGQLLLPLLGMRRWLLLFGGGALAGHLANNLFSDSPAVGISAAVLAMLGCAVFPFGKMPVRFMLLHDILRLPPFRLSSVAAFFVMLDIIGVISGWHFFAHTAHLAGFALGAAFGYFHFPRRLL